MHHYFLKIALGYLFTIVFISCADFIEYPMEDKEVALLAPADLLATNDTVITFWWDTNQDARFYRLQVVSPNFDSISNLWIDSLVTGDKASFQLAPGKYTWRLRPENHGSVGKYNYRQFTIRSLVNEE